MSGNGIACSHRDYCTYFDHRYLPFGLALHASLLRHGGDFTLWVLALDEVTAEYLEASRLAGVQVVRLSELEAADPRLKAVRDTRSLVEYYFTCSPAFPRMLLESRGLPMITYLDSDLWFFSSPEPLFQVFEGGSVALVPHRFSHSAARSHARFGRYNVGWLTFRNDQSGNACLDWWHERCLDWCHDRVEGERYADQKYLDRFEDLFADVVSLNHPGANLAPWNVARHRIELDTRGIVVDQQPLVFFHFQGLRRVVGNMWDSNLTGYGAQMTKTLREEVFRPYIACLGQAEAIVEEAMPHFSTRRLRRSHLGFLHRVASQCWRTTRSALAGNLVLA